MKNFCLLELATSKKLIDGDFAYVDKTFLVQEMIPR